MQKVFLGNLLKKKGIGINKNKETCDWENCIGSKIKFLYGETTGEIEIIGYNKDTKFLTVSYFEKEFTIYCSSFKVAQIGAIIGLHSRSSDYLYSIGEMLEVHSGKIKIIKHTREKYKNTSSKNYDYKCLNCNEINNARESYLKNKNGCPVCSNMKIKIGYSDLWTVNPALARKLLNSEDGYRCTPYSKNRVDWKCSDCGEVIRNKRVGSIAIQGLSCPRCSDGVSYPNKIGFNLLQQLNLNFKNEYCPIWAKPKRYDFYFEKDDKKFILEMDGGFHGKNNKMSRITAEESRAADRHKDILAEEHGIEVIRINCEKSQIDYIKNNLFNSKMAELFNLNNIDWNKCEEFSCKNLTKLTSDLWNSGIKNNKILREKLKISRATVYLRLKRGASLGWCNYNAKDREFKLIKIPVVQLNKKTGEVIEEYISMSDAQRKTGIKTNVISACCKSPEKRQSRGYKWMYLKDYKKNIAV